jgi:hypothetical protein
MNHLKLGQNKKLLLRINHQNMAYLTAYKSLRNLTQLISNIKV